MIFAIKAFSVGVCVVMPNLLFQLDLVLVVSEIMM